LDLLLEPICLFDSRIVANSLSGTTVTCAQSDPNIFNPPAGQTCQSFAGAFVEVSGKLLNPDATSACEYCRCNIGDQYLQTLNMSFNAIKLAVKFNKMRETTKSELPSTTSVWSSKMGRMMERLM
jgi:hypothetical protein